MGLGMSTRGDNSVSATQIIENPLFVGAFSDLDQSILDELKCIELDGSEKSAQYVVALTQKLQAAASVRALLEQHISSAAIGEYNQAQKDMRSGITKR